MRWALRFYNYDRAHRIDKDFAGKIAGQTGFAPACTMRHVVLEASPRRHSLLSAMPGIAVSFISPSSACEHLTSCGWLPALVQYEHIFGANIDTELGEKRKPGSEVGAV
jgi:hypothetical protein